MLAEKIAQAQAGNEQSMLEMIDRFKHLLGRYARLLRYEDAQNEMTLEFILLMKRIDTSIFKGKGDGAVVNYIVQAVKHIYIRLSKQYDILRTKELLMDDLSDEQRYYLEGCMVSPDDELLDFMTLLSAAALTSTERNVLIMEFYYGLSSADIAKGQAKSRQSVNQVKKKALKKLYASIH